MSTIGAEGGEVRRAVLWIVGIIFAGAAVVAVGLRVPAVQDALIEGAIGSRLRAPRDRLVEPDALRVLICGSSSPLPHPTRAGPCVAVFAGGRFWIVDAGRGAWNKLALWQVPGERIAGVLLTHFHSDHIGGLGTLNMQTWVLDRAGPLNVYGPTGVQRVVAGLTEAYAQDTSYRIAHHGADFLSREKSRMVARPFPSSTAPRVVLEEGGMKISAFAVDHSPIEPAVGYRFDYRGRSVVVSGDTVQHTGLIAAAKDVDVLVHEALSKPLLETMSRLAGEAGRPRLAKIAADVLDYHTDPIEAAEAANEANARLLVLYHLVPPPRNALMQRVFERGIADVRPEGWIVAHDGLLVELPLDSDAIETRSLD